MRDGSRQRLVGLVVALLTLVAAGPYASGATPPARTGPSVAANGDMMLGDRKAKVQVVEYASLTCPHCARFHAQVFPAFKAKYIDTGRVSYVLREFLTPPTSVAAAGFITARCAGSERYFDVIAGVFRSQSQWSAGARVKPILLEVAKANGLTEAQFEACLSDEAALKAMNDRMETALQADVQSTPAFFVNGRKVKDGEIALFELDAAIAAARR